MEAFHLGGWAMYPTALVGIAFVFAAARYARRPDRQRRRIVVNVGALMSLIGALGFAMGLVKSFTSVPAEADAGVLVVHGVGESLCNLGLVLAMLMIGALVMTVGAVSAPPAGELADPQEA